MTILVAEDDYAVRSLVRMSLEGAGYSVAEAKDGLEAYDIFCSQPVDLCLLDVMMPRLDGFNLLRKIREHSTVPVIFLTARAEGMDIVLGLGLGADDYMAKPFSADELLARVGAHLRRSREYGVVNDSASDIIAYGQLSIDRNTYTACKNGVPLALGTKEYKLLLHFMENPERVFTKRQLYSAVWVENDWYDDNTVMVHISRLRSHIEEEPGNPRYLKTIRGVGYKLHITGEKP